MSENELNLRIADRIKFFLDERNKTQADLAKYMDVSPVTISNWCKGIKMPRMNKIDKICSFLHVSRSALMDETPVTSFSANNLDNLTEEEQAHLEAYRKLNIDGQKRVDDFLDDLNASGRYQLSLPDGDIIKKSENAG